MIAKPKAPHRASRRCQIDPTKVAKQYREATVVLHRVLFWVPSAPPPEDPRPIWFRSHRKTCLRPGFPRRRPDSAALPLLAVHAKFPLLRDFGCAIRAVHPDLSGYQITSLHCARSRAFDVNLVTTPGGPSRCSVMGQCVDFWYVGVSRPDTTNARPTILPSSGSPQSAFGCALMNPTPIATANWSWPRRSPRHHGRSSRREVPRG